MEKTTTKRPPGTLTTRATAGLGSARSSGDHRRVLDRAEDRRARRAELEAKGAALDVAFREAIEGLEARAQASPEEAEGLLAAAAFLQRVIRPDA